MGLVDKNANPLPKTTNGEAERSVLDVRAVPTGTLLFNLIKFTMEETGLDSMRQQLLHIKEQSKMVQDPPQLAAITEHLQQVATHRFIMCKELNDRFAKHDEEYRLQLGIEVIIPLVGTAPATGTGEAPAPEGSSIIKP